MEKVGVPRYSRITEHAHQIFAPTRLHASQLLHEVGLHGGNFLQKCVSLSEDMSCLLKQVPLGIVFDGRRMMFFETCWLDLQSLRCTGGGSITKRTSEVWMRTCLHQKTSQLMCLHFPAKNGTRQSRDSSALEIGPRTENHPRTISGRCLAHTITLHIHL